MEVTLLPRITCSEAQSVGVKYAKRKAFETDHSSNGVSLSRSRFLLRVVEHKIQKQIVTAQSSTDFATALQMHEQSLVHKLSLDANQ